MTDSAPHSAFLVSCVGAYQDSGIGTGGFICVQNKAITTIDTFDCTGLCQSGDRVYRFVRALKAILGYDKSGLQFFLRLPQVRDVHDIAIENGTITCVSTGTNEVFQFDAFGHERDRWQAAGTEDAWHLNCLCLANGQLHVSAFGEFGSHRDWVGNCSQTGFILNLETQEKVVAGLSGPHNPRYIDGSWIVCNSHEKSVVIVPSSGDRKTIQLEGFTRGLAWDEHYFYVGESADRKQFNADSQSFITIIDRQTFSIRDRIPLPFPEIYDIVLISEAFAQQIQTATADFQFDFNQARIEILESQVQRSQQAYQDLKNRRRQAKANRSNTGTKSDRSSQQTAHRKKNKKSSPKKPAKLQRDLSLAGTMTWEEAVEWLRRHPDGETAVLNSYFDDPVSEAADRFFHSEEWQATAALLKDKLSGQVLDIGAGRGIASYAFAQHGATVTALEPDPSQIVGAGAIRQLAQETGVSIAVVEDWGERLPFPDCSFDIVYGRAVLHHAKDLPQLCKEISRVLKPSGILLAVREHVISHPNDLPRFLDAHLLHWLYGGEFADLLTGYTEAIAASGLQIRTVLAPFDSVINYAPMTRKQFQNKLKRSLSRYTGQTIAASLAQRNSIQQVYGWHLSRKTNKPGRHYSFLAQKPA